MTILAAMDAIDAQNRKAAEKASLGMSMMVAPQANDTATISLGSPPVSTSAPVVLKEDVDAKAEGSIAEPDLRLGRKGGKSSQDIEASAQLSKPERNEDAVAAMTNSSHHSMDDPRPDPAPAEAKPNDAQQISVSANKMDQETGNRHREARKEHDRASGVASKHHSHGDSESEAGRHEQEDIAQQERTDTDKHERTSRGGGR